MKKLTLVAFLFACISFSVQSQTPDCKKFKTGKFYYPALQGNKISLRKDSIQESYNDGKLEMVWKVKWLSECQYEMTCIQVVPDPYPIKVGDRIVATIIKTEGDCFTTSLMFYYAEKPEGVMIPPAEMCIKKD